MQREKQEAAAVLTSKHHSFSRFKTWESLDRLILKVECVSNLSLLHILHPCYYVAHLTCKSTQQQQQHTMLASISGDSWDNFPQDSRVYIQCESELPRLVDWLIMAALTMAESDLKLLYYIENYILYRKHQRLKKKQPIYTLNERLQ